MVNAAMGNNPCIFTRTCQLVKFSKVSQQCIDDHYSRGKNVSGGDLGDVGKKFWERPQTMTNKVAISHLKVLAKYSPTYTWSCLYLLSLLFDRVEEAYGSFVTHKVVRQNSAKDILGPGGVYVGRIAYGQYTEPHPQSFFAMTIRCLSNLQNKKRRDTTERIRLTREEIEIEVLAIIPQDRIVREAALCLLDKLYAARPSVTTSIALGILNTVGSQAILAKVFGKVLQDFLHYELHFSNKLIDMIEYPTNYMCGGIGMTNNSIASWRDTLFETLVDDDLKWLEAKEVEREKFFSSDEYAFCKKKKLQGELREYNNRIQRASHPSAMSENSNGNQRRAPDCLAVEDDGRLMISMDDYPPL